MKKIRFVMLFCITALLISTAVFGAFEKTRTYDGRFADVTADNWYASEVENAYELSLMNGVSDSAFLPMGNVTVAEAITVASRVNAIYYAREIPDVAGIQWYDGYVSYALACGIITEGDFDSYDRNIKRLEMAELFHNALPESEFAGINDVTYIPDVAKDTKGYHSLIALYRAGIVMGSDQYGTFKPYSDITRAEAAAIINRVAFPDNRLKKSLVVKKQPEAYILCFHNSFSEANGWVLDNRGGLPKINSTGGITPITDISTNEATALIRRFNRVEDDVITTDARITVYGRDAAVGFFDESGNAVYRLSLVDGSWYILGADGKDVLIKENAMEQDFAEFDLLIVTDLKGGSSKTYINDEYLGEHPIFSNSFSEFRYFIDEESTGTIVPGAIRMTANYAVYEEFDYGSGLEELYGWHNNGAELVNGEIRMTDRAKVSKSFDSISGRVNFECYLYTEGADGVQLLLKNGQNTVVEFTLKDGAFYAGGVKVYEKCTDKMWYRLRIEADTHAKKGDMLINGRKTASFDLPESTGIDTLEICGNTGAVKVDEFRIYNVYNHADYVPEPTCKAELDDYIVGVNVCSLWQNGDGAWGRLAPFETHTPLIGMYDECVPETADWEIKYMVEHGIDFQAFCWFAGNTVTSPIKRADWRNDHLLEGYMYAEYSDYMKYVIMWETYGSGHAKINSHQFRTFIVPYWFENFFLDDRYLKIDNKIVLPIYAGYTLSGDMYFGSVENAKAELDYLEETAKSYGFDGFIFLANDESSDVYANMGIDASWTYNRGANGAYVSHNKDKILSSEGVTSMHTVPTACVGFNNIPWSRNNRTPMMSVSDYEQLNTWIRDEYLTKYDKDSWKSKLVMLSSWNEYGEGHYIMPAGENGFGYLDVLRSVYTDYADDHIDLTPSPSQSERITHLYPQELTFLARDGSYKEDASSLDATVLARICPLEDNVTLISIDNASFGDGTLTAFSAGNDPVVNFKGSMDIDLTNVSLVSLTVGGVSSKANVDGSLFFTTYSDTAMDQNKCFKFKPAQELTTFYFDAAGNSQFKGMLKNLRVDPFECTKDEAAQFTLGEIVFYSTGEKPQLVVNAVTVDNVISAKNASGRLLFPFDPESGIGYMLGSLSEFNRHKGTLSVSGNGHTVIYTMGSNECIHDGSTKEIGYTVDTVDGIPMLDFAQLSEMLGYKYTVSGSVCEIVTDEYTTVKEMYVEEIPKDPGSFEFDTRRAGLWRSDMMSLVPTGNSMLCISTSANLDPQLYYVPVLQMPADKYKAIEIRYRCNYKNSSDTPSYLQLFFQTDISSKWSESKSIRLDLDGIDTSSQWKTLTYDLSSLETWDGYVTAFRLDPFVGYGTMEFDYIRFEQDETYVEVDLFSLPFEIKCGDAENAVEGNYPFYTDGAKLSVFEESNGNKAWKVEGTSTNPYTFIRQKVYFKQGRKYHIEFDARLLGDSAGNTDVSGVIVCDLRYRDESAVRADKTDHIIGQKQISTDDGWVHFSFDYNVTQVDSDVGHEFTIYLAPIEGSSGIYMIDNLTVIESEI